MISTSTENPGRLVSVETAFHRQAVKPGGIDRRNAMQAVKIVLKDTGTAIERRLDEALDELLASLAGPSQQQPEAQVLVRLLNCSNDVRDMAGLVDRHLLTETATFLSDVLDAMVFENRRIEAPEALVFASALHFSRLEAQRGVTLAPYAELLGQLKDLTNHLLSRPIEAR